MKKVIIRQKTGGNEWIALGAEIAFLAGSILMYISHFKKKVDATIPILIVFSVCTIVVALITVRLFLTRNVLILKDDKLILKGIIINKKIKIEDIEYFKLFKKRNEIKLKIKKHEFIIVPKTLDIEYLSQFEFYQEF